MMNCGLRIADCKLILTEYRLMHPEEFKKRTKVFAVRVINLVDRLPSSRATNAIANQLVRSGMSVGANYRAACRAKSRADFISKMGTVEEEGDETLYWMELLVESGKVKAAVLKDLMREAGEILAITVASINTARSKKNPQSAIRNPQ
jgi:four helix bundle protein